MNWVGWRDVYKGIYELDYTVKCFFLWPSSIVTSQTKYTSSTVTPFFEIDEITSSCGNTVTYTIHTSSSLLGTPYGMNPSPSGDRQFLVLDGENPAQYSFVIQASHSNAEVASVFSPQLSLQIRCPDPLIFIQPTYQTMWSSFIGAQGS